MESFPILLALWFYPTISYWIIKKTKDKPVVRKKYFKIISFATFLVILGFQTKIYAISSIINWAALTIPFLLLCSLLWVTREFKQKGFRIFGLISMVIVFGFGFLLSTVGLLGLMFVLGDYQPSITKPISENLTYSETWLGNAISNDRGRRYEVHQQINWLPILKRQVACKEVFHHRFYHKDSTTVIFDLEEEKLFISVIPNDKSDMGIWNDTLNLNIW